MRTTLQRRVLLVALTAGACLPQAVTCRTNIPEVVVETYPVVYYEEVWYEDEYYYDGGWWGSWWDFDFWFDDYGW